MLKRAVGEKVACDLFDGELIEGHVLAECFDDQVAVWPDRAIVVDVNAVRVGVTGGVEPMASKVLGVSLGFEKLFGSGLDRSGEIIGGEFLELFDFLRRGRKSGDVEGEASNETV